MKTSYASSLTFNGMTKHTGEPKQRTPLVWNHIGSVILNMLTLYAVDRGFKPWSGQTKNYEILICCFSAKHSVLKSKNKNRLAA